MDGDQFLWALAEAVDGLLEQGCVAAIKGHKAEIREDGAAAWGEKTEVEADAQEPRLRLTQFPPWQGWAGATQRSEGPGVENPSALIMEMGDLIEGSLQVRVNLSP